MTDTTLEPAEAGLSPASIAPDAAETGAPPVESSPRRLLNRWSILGGLITVAILFLLGWGLINTNRTRPEPGQMAPAFEVQFFDGYDWDGRTVATLDDMRGQVVVLNFWASWCVECRLEADLLEDSWRAYRDQGVLFLGVAYVDVEPKSLEYMREFDITYPNAPDLESIISGEYRVTGVPETFFIGKDGRVRQVVIGPVSQQQIDRTVRELLAEEA